MRIFEELTDLQHSLFWSQFLKQQTCNLWFFKTPRVWNLISYHYRQMFFFPWLLLNHYLSICDRLVHFGFGFELSNHFSFAHFYLFTMGISGESFCWRDWNICFKEFTLVSSNSLTFETQRKFLPVFNIFFFFAIYDFYHAPMKLFSVIIFCYVFKALSEWYKARCEPSNAAVS